MTKLNFNLYPIQLLWHRHVAPVARSLACLPRSRPLRWVIFVPFSSSSSLKKKVIRSFRPEPNLFFFVFFSCVGWNKKSLKTPFDFFPFFFFYFSMSEAWDERALRKGKNFAGTHKANEREWGKLFYHFEESYYWLKGQMLVGFVVRHSICVCQQVGGERER